MADFIARIVRHPKPSLTKALKALKRLYGKPTPPKVTDPFELILYENVAYLADDERRDEAFGRLRDRIGLSPEKILQAAASTLREVAGAGIVPAQQGAESLLGMGDMLYLTPGHGLPTRCHGAYVSDASADG